MFDIIDARCNHEVHYTGQFARPLIFSLRKVIYGLKVELHLKTHKFKFLPHSKHTISLSVKPLKESNNLIILGPLLLATHKYRSWFYTEVYGTNHINSNVISRVQQVRCKRKSSEDTRVSQNIPGRWPVSKDDVRILRQRCGLSRKIFVPRENDTCNCVHVIFMI